MKKNSRLFLFGALILVLLTAACGAEQGATPTLVGTTIPGEETSTLSVDLTGTAETATGELETATAGATDIVSTQPTTDATLSAATRSPGIPVTGPDIVLIECQFCVDTVAHALLVLPDTATFTITSPPLSSTTSSTSVSATNPVCTTVEVNNGKQVVLCSGPEMTPLTLNICTNATTCTDFPVDLLACPVLQSGTLVPNVPLEATATGAGGAATATSTLPVVINTPTP